MTNNLSLVSKMYYFLLAFFVKNEITNESRLRINITVWQKVIALEVATTISIPIHQLETPVFIGQKGRKSKWFDFTTVSCITIVVSVLCQCFEFMVLKYSNPDIFNLVHFQPIDPIQD